MKTYDIITSIILDQGTAWENKFLSKNLPPHIDEKYQSMLHSKKCNPILLRRRKDGRLIIVNGWTTWQLALRLGWNSIPACIISGETNDSKLS